MPPSSSPPWCFSAWIVATRTTTLGAMPPEPADDVDELLEAHVGAEAALGDDVVAELEPEPVGDERVVAVRDVRERAAVDERRLALGGLHEVRLQRLLEQHRHRAGGADLLGGHRLARRRSSRP